MRRLRQLLLSIRPTAGPIQSGLLLGTLFLFALSAPVPQAAAQSCVAPPSGLVSWWPGDGNAKDIVGGNHGTLQGNATFAAGKVGQAFSFDGNGDFVQVFNSTNLNIQGPLTIDFWVKINATPGSKFYALVDKVIGLNGYVINVRPTTGIFNDGKIELAILNNGTIKRAISDSPAPVGQFFHVAGVFDGTNAKLYIDGVLQSFSQTSAPPGSSAGAELRIGSSQFSPGRELNGLIDEVEIYDRALSDAEIRDIFDAGGAGKCKVDHFLCYKAKTTPGTEKFLPISGITLTDQFGTETVEVKKPVSLCNPADKNGEGIFDPDTHLRGYKIKPETAHVPQTNILVKNQFHPDGLSVDTIKPDRLLVPTLKDLDEPVILPDPFEPNVDHFKCYKVKVTPGTPKLPKGIQASVKDQFNEVAKLFDIKKPSRLCNPVDKNGEGIKNEAAHLMCYKVKPVTAHTPLTGIHTNNQFGPEVLDTIKEEELCVPSEKIIE